MGVDIAGLQPDSIVQIGYCNPECARRPWSLPTRAATPTSTVVVGAPCGTCGIAVIGSAHDTLAPVPFARRSGPAITPADSRLDCYWPPPCSPPPGASPPRSTGARHPRPTLRTSTPPNSNGLRPSHPYQEPRSRAPVALEDEPGWHHSLDNRSGADIGCPLGRCRSRSSSRRLLTGARAGYPAAAC